MCNPILGNISINEIKKHYNFEIKLNLKNTTKYHKNTTKYHKKTQNTTKNNQCKYCNKKMPYLEIMKNNKWQLVNKKNIIK